MPSGGNQHWVGTSTGQPWVPPVYRPEEEAHQRPGQMKEEPVDSGDGRQVGL